MGGRWCDTSLKRMAGRLGLTLPPSKVPSDMARALVQAMWKQHPECTVKQVQATLERDHNCIVGRCLIQRLLSEFRLTAARRSAVYRVAGWWLNYRTIDRIRIAAICKQHPEYSAKRVLKVLRPTYPMKVKWVNQIMNEYRQAQAKGTPSRAGQWWWTPKQRILQAKRLRQLRLWDHVKWPRAPYGNALPAKNVSSRDRGRDAHC